jgi:hypothetical protein
MATTTNYGWTTPDDTALVKDGASAIRTLGSSIDTTTKNLNPSTTLGDIEYRSSTANTNTRLGIGTTGQILAVSGGVPAWTTPASSGTANWTLLNSGGTALTGAATITVSGISGADKILVLISSASTSTGSSDFNVRLNTDTGSNYFNYGGYTSTDDSVAEVGYISGSYSSISLAQAANSASVGAGYVMLTGCSSSGVKAFTFGGGSSESGVAGGQRGKWGGGYYNSASTISSVSAFATSGNFDAGSIFVYTSA